MSRLDYVIVRMRSWLANYGDSVTTIFREDVLTLLEAAEETARRGAATSTDSPLPGPQPSQTIDEELRRPGAYE